MKKTYFQNWKTELSEHKYLILLSVLFFLFSYIMTYFASKYVDSANTTPVQDLILDNIPTINLGILFSYGMILLFVVTLFYILFFKVKQFHIIVFSFSTLILVRSFFITLTHLGNPADAVLISNLPTIYQGLTYQNDLFFSGHAAIPFMGYLLFRKEKIGIFFLVMTIILSLTVLFMHVHYSIDVFAAFFITYAVYKLTEWFSEKYFTKE